MLRTALLCATALVLPTAASAALMPLTSFGGGDGWLAPGEGGYAFLGTANNERGLAYNPTTGNLLLVSRSGGNNIRILDGLSGADLGSLNLGTGVISGGTFPINMVGVGTDGAIYVNNLTTNSTTSAYKVYRWASESASTPTVAYSGDAALPGSRVGDSFDVTGGGTSTQFASGYGATPAVPGNNSYVVHTTADGLAYTATAVALTGPVAGDFRLGITFQDSDTVIGTQKGGLTNPGNPVHVTDFAGAVGTLIASPTLSTTAERPMDFAVVDGVPLLAIQSTGDSTLRLYDMTNPASPALFDVGNLTSGTLAANGNGVGQVKFGSVVGDTAIIYAMSTNQGIQAFYFAIPEPIGAGFLAFTLLARRRRA